MKNLQCLLFATILPLSSCGGSAASGPEVASTSSNHTSSSAVALNSSERAPTREASGIEWQDAEPEWEWDSDLGFYTDERS